MNVQEVGGSALVGFYAVHILQWLKYQPWFPLMKEGQSWLNRSFSWAIAVATSFGVHFVFNQLPDGGGSMSLSWPHLTLAGFAGDVLRQYAVMKFSYASSVGDHPNGGSNK